jgi:hypothetical protein
MGKFVKNGMSGKIPPTELATEMLSANAILPPPPPALLGSLSM